MINRTDISTDGVGRRYVFKSKVLPGNQRAIICSYSKNDIFDCVWYDILKNAFYNYTKTEIEGANFYAYNIIIEYFEETHEILIGKPNNIQPISIMECSQELECTDPIKKTISFIKNYMSRLNIVLLSDKNGEKKYYAIANDRDKPGEFKFELELPVGLVCKSYFNINKTSCLPNVPDGYYCNDTEAKTIAKCEEKCSTCNKDSHDLNKCLICNNEMEYYGFSNETNNKYKLWYYKNTSFERLYLIIVFK